MLILVDQVVHLLLQRVDDQVQLVTLIDQLADGGELLTELELFAIQIRLELVTSRHSLDLLLVDVDQVSVLLGAVVLENVNFVLENLDSLLHLSEILTASLNLADILVSLVLYALVLGDK